MSSNFPCKEIKDFGKHLVNNCIVYFRDVNSSRDQDYCILTQVDDEEDYFFCEGIYDNQFCICIVYKSKTGPRSVIEDEVWFHQVSNNRMSMKAFMKKPILDIVSLNE